VILVPPLRAPGIEIHPNATWQQNGLTVAGGNRQGNGINQFSYPFGLYVDDDQTVYVADPSNHRIVEWKWGATSGRVVAGGNGQGSGAHQLSYPQDVIVDKERDSLIICDSLNQRVVRWPRRNGTRGETIISNIDCRGSTMDESGSLYVTDKGKHEVRRYGRGESEGTAVAGGNGIGNRVDQLSNPRCVFVDRDHSVYVSDLGNHRVMKWVKGAKQGIVVAGGQGKGNGLTQLSNPRGVVVDQLGSVYVAEAGNNRIMRWVKGATQGSVIVGGNGEGEQSNQLKEPIGLSFDRHGNLYVVDNRNHRVQKFNIENTGNKFHIKLDRFNISANDQQLSKLSGEGSNSGHLKSNC
jgi:sugar lactone lactonase YvrE